jgi:2-keto-4-pentenoate hydratase
MALRVGDDGGIAAAFPVIELRSFVFRAPRKTLSELVANNGLNAGVVLPDDAWLSAPLYPTREATLSVRINGCLYGSSGLWPLPNGPAASLEWLQRNLACSGLRLEPDDIVLAGTPLAPAPGGDE